MTGGPTLATSVGNVALSTDLDSLLEQSQPEVMLELTNSTVGMDAAVKGRCQKGKHRHGCKWFFRRAIETT
ncbi:MAG: hypothetical protein Ct9H300mP11_27130 [Chloroflexota bacterium]|nr:MAG: hypothetical protein Ct9H300mP11_27130 [Chloroflexota bacterium]